ncbi:transcriptional regulator [Conexibacter sp. W3-3-2]|uniref:winged helix-turn-helix transcriptional regulator n=1 Tax=Conexibacter sp. W3-3-2 TaxID=2675227 RepID=UPI0012B753FF|nr:helix-turn-helix domain-containing protein [Conexibacter sp. W3-3-2]MTD44808.1 transcriptional regulator [Conexibacter sp. W3-3-2]
MQRTSFEEFMCPIAQTLEVIGEWWTPLILRDIAFGLTRFDEIQRNLGISRKVLTERLNGLVEAGVLKRQAYSEKPPRHDYFLTEKGADLGAILLAMKAWGDRWSLPGKPTVEVRHETCGGITGVELRCTCCGEPLNALDLTPLEGPGMMVGPGTSELPAGLERLRAARAGEPIPGR